MDAGGAGHLGQPLHRALDILAGHHHQVGHFVDHHHQVGHGIGANLLALVDGAAGVIKAGLHGAFKVLTLGPGLARALIVAGDIAHADLRHLAVAVFHFPHSPFQSHDGLLRIGNHRGKQVRNAVVDAEFQHLRVDHDETALFRAQPVEDRQDHRIDPHRLA